MRIFILAAIVAKLCSAWQTTAPQSMQPPRTESLIVTGTAQPVPMAEADRDINVLAIPEKQRPLFNSWLNLLELDSGLDLQERAPGAFQADLSIRGATFGQTLVLLNGLRINDVQTGHFNLDVPVPLEMISGIEVLKGSGSALYGSDAVGGVVNIRTEPIPQGEFRLLAGMGNFGSNEQHVVATFGKSWWQEELSLARDSSSGFTADRDYRNLSLGSLSTLKSRLGATSLLFAYSDRPFGANNFYGVNQPQWERVKT